VANSPNGRKLRFVGGKATQFSHHIGGTGIVAVKFLNETPTAPKYDPIAPASRD
jgi:hypothetical protein